MTASSTRAWTIACRARHGGGATRAYRPRAHYDRYHRYQPDHRTRRKANDKHPLAATGCTPQACGTTLTLRGVARSAS